MKIHCLTPKMWWPLHGLCKSLHLMFEVIPKILVILYSWTLNSILKSKSWKNVRQNYTCKLIGKTHLANQKTCYIHCTFEPSYLKVFCIYFFNFEALLFKNRLAQFDTVMYISYNTCHLLYKNNAHTQKGRKTYKYDRL